MAYKDAEERRTDMVMALGLFDLTERDNQLFDWITTTWDQHTTDALTDLLHRARR